MSESKADGQSYLPSHLILETILIAPNPDGKGAKAYHATLVDNEYALTASPREEEHSPLVVSLEHIARLQSAHIYIIVSSQSGAGLAATTYHNILSPLLKTFSMEAEVHETSSKSSHCEFLSSTSFSADHENIIITLGGDTIIYDLINSLYINSTLTPSHRITIVSIPCGTGNALAMSLGTTSIPISISKLFGVSTTSTVQTKPLPLMKITLSQHSQHTLWGAVVCSWGLHASLVADSDALEMRQQYGPKRFGVYLSAILSQVAAERLLTPSPHVYQGKLMVSDATIANEHTYLLLTHVSHLEPTFPIAPKQSPLMSSISVVHIGPMSGEGLMGVMRAVYDHSKHLQMEGVDFREGIEKVEFEIDEDDARWRRICVDGEIITLDKGTVVSVQMGMHSEMKSLYCLC
jgi:diacylglycerol kinase family enzyme